MKTITAAGMLILAILGLAFAAQAQPGMTNNEPKGMMGAGQHGMMWQGSGGWGCGSAYTKLYDPKTIETLKGEVVEITPMTPRKGMSRGVHLLLKTDKETISVHLGPAWFLENQDTKIEPKDTIEVTGSRITFDGKPAIIAEKVRKGDEVLTLRDDRGVPLWAGWRKRGPTM
jgi:hypothetical protein